jgi:HEXXH motif-containing protein
MNTGYLRMPTDLLAAMAAGSGGPAVTSILAGALHSKHALLLRGVVMTSAATGHAEAALAQCGYDLLGSVQRSDPGAATALIRHPSVGAWAYRTVLALRGGPEMNGATPAVLAAVAAAAAVRAGVPAEIEVPLTDGLVMLPSLGTATISTSGQSGLATVRVTSGGAEVTTPEVRVVIPADYRVPAPGWRPLQPLLTVPVALLADDIDPFRMPAAPHLAQPTSLSSWSPVFQRAWTLLDRHHPDVAADVAALVTVIVPLARPAQGQVSSSSPETSGAIALSEPTDACVLACTLAHEVQHVKLSALLDLVRLTLDDEGRRFYAPWREDPRPISGLLQGAYAYLGVSGFWRRQRLLDTGIDADAQFARWRAAATIATNTLLSSGLLTVAGQDFARGMSATLAAWQEEPVPEPACRRAAEENARHLAQWESAHGEAALSAV